MGCSLRPSPGRAKASSLSSKGVTIGAAVKAAPLESALLFTPAWKISALATELQAILAVRQQ
jgi:hypothetical protein